MAAFRRTDAKKRKYYSVYKLVCRQLNKGRSTLFLKNFSLLRMLKSSFNLEDN